MGLFWVLFTVLQLTVAVVDSEPSTSTANTLSTEPFTSTTDTLSTEPATSTADTLSTEPPTSTADILITEPTTRTANILSTVQTTRTANKSSTELIEDLNHYGTEFYLAMANNQIQGNRTLHIASNSSGVLRVEVPEININDEQELVKGYTKYNISVTFPWRMDIYLSTTVPVAVTVVDEDRGTGVFLALPIAFAGTSFMAAGSKGWYFGIAVMAIYDKTSVSLVDLDNKTESYTLNRLGIIHTRDYPDKTGTVISASRPVTVNSGTTTHASGSGLSIEQMIPYEAWTDMFIVPPLPSKEQFSVRTLSMEAQNICFRNLTSETCFQVTKPTTNTTYDFGTDSVLVTSSSRVSVVQYETVSGRFSGGDGIMVVIPGIKNYLNTYRFVIPDIPNTDPYIVCIVLSSDANGLLLDRSSVTFDTSQSVVTSLGNYSVLKTNIESGYHEMRHSKVHVRFGALVYGFDGQRSYAFPLGFSYLRRVNVGPWTPWSDCAVKYIGFQSRSRFCENQTQMFNGDVCTGVDIEERQCYTRTCQVNGEFNGWSVWSSCSHTCGPGKKIRRRYCNNPEPLHGGADCIGEATETQPCKERSCPVVPYGYECIPTQDKCDGNHTSCDEGRCRCYPSYYFDGDRCIAKTDVCGEQSNVIIVVVGVVMGVVIIVLAVYAVYVTVQLRRKTPEKGLSSHQRKENQSQANEVFNSGTGNVTLSAEPQYTSLYSDLKDKSDAYDVINKH